MLGVKETLSGKLSAFTGNSGVGKSSLLNCWMLLFACPLVKSAENWGVGGIPLGNLKFFTWRMALWRIRRVSLRWIWRRARSSGKRSSLFVSRNFCPILGIVNLQAVLIPRIRAAPFYRPLRMEKIEPKRHESYVAFYESVKDLKDWETG